MKSQQKRRLKIYSAMALGLTVVPLVESVTNTAIVAYAAGVEKVGPSDKPVVPQRYENQKGHSKVHPMF
ncbi:hypothetical protein ACX4ZB_06905 [Aerococcus urinae]